MSSLTMLTAIQPPPVAPNADNGMPAELKRVYGLPQTASGFPITHKVVARPPVMVEPGGPFAGFSIIPPVRYSTRAAGIGTVPQVVAGQNWRRHYLLIQNAGPDPVWLGADVRPVAAQNAILINVNFEREIERPSCEIQLVSTGVSVVYIMEGVYETGG